MNRLNPGTASCAPRGRRDGGRVSVVLVVVCVLVALGVGLGLRALLNAGSAGARKREKTEQFYWPIADATGPGQGVVGVMLPDEGFVSVGDVRPEDWKLNHEVRFVDKEGRVVAHGVVRAVVGGKLHVKYEPEPGAPRALQQGDRAIRTGKVLPDTRQPATAPAE
jgi:hypothetical protein